MPRTPTPAASEAIARVRSLRARSTPPPPEQLDELIAHVVTVQHAAIRELLAALAILADELGDAPGGGVVRMHEAVDAVAASLATHLAKEERVLFPHLLEPERARDSLEAPMRLLAEDHASARAAIDDLIAATRLVLSANPGEPVAEGFADAVAVLADDVARHVRLEESVLFPAARLRERLASPYSKDPT